MATAAWTMFFMSNPHLIVPGVVIATICLGLLILVDLIAKRKK